MRVTDLMGQAIKDHFAGKDTEDLWNETSISEKDVLPLKHLFRDFDDMRFIEQKALELARGKILDVGCGAGSHSLYLQKQGHDVTALDLSTDNIEVAKARGVMQTRCESIYELEHEKFDTLLLLMNGTGLFGRLDQTKKALEHLRSLLAPQGQILIDSSDLQYMYDYDEAGNLDVPEYLKYYGELECVLHYKGQQSEPYYWLYLDPETFGILAQLAGLQFELIEEGENFDYLARLTAV